MNINNEITAARYIASKQYIKDKLRKRCWLCLGLGALAAMVIYAIIMGAMI